jgi:meso-butanediol dehydrogenase / (S,S)-butanediol dehydrogenase / diacetyl reductase
MESARTAIVTGAAMGIGRAIALRLATDGCNVIVNDLPSQEIALQSLIKEIESKSVKAQPFLADVSVEDNVQKLVNLAVTTFGRLDIVSQKHSQMPR